MERWAKAINKIFPGKDIPMSLKHKGRGTLLLSEYLRYQQCPQNVRQTPIVGFFPSVILSFCHLAQDRSVSVGSGVIKVSVLVSQTEDQHGEPQGKKKLWGRFQKSRSLGKQSHEAYEVLGSPLNCACVNLILKSILKYLRSKPRVDCILAPRLKIGWHTCRTDLNSTAKV